MQIHLCMHLNWVWLIGVLMQWPQKGTFKSELIVIALTKYQVALFKKKYIFFHAGHFELT